MSGKTVGTICCRLFSCIFDYDDYVGPNSCFSMFFNYYVEESEEETASDEEVQAEQSCSVVHLPRWIEGEHCRYGSTIS